MDKTALKMNNRVPFRIHALPSISIIPDKAFLWIDSAHMDVVKATMPGVIKAEETERSVDSFVHTREFELSLDPLAESQQDAINALTDYLNAEIGIPATPAQEG